MKIVVCIKHVPDVQSERRLEDGHLVRGEDDVLNELFVERITEQMLEESDPDPDGAEALKRVAQALELAKPRATSAVNAAFRIVLQDRIERTIEAGFAEQVEALGNPSDE